MANKIFNKWGLLILLLIIVSLGLAIFLLLQTHSKVDEHSTEVDNRGGDFCPKCKSTDVGKFFYGLYSPELEDSATIEAVKNHRLIPGGCVIMEDCPKYKCNSCSYMWGKYY